MQYNQAYTWTLTKISDDMSRLLLENLVGVLFPYNDNAELTSFMTNP